MAVVMHGVISSPYPTPSQVSNLKAALTNDTGTPTKLPFSLDMQDHSFPTRNSHISFSKQFIPVVVLGAFLLLFFASHLLRYPRILHIPPRIGDASAEEGYGDRQRPENHSSKAAIPPSRSFLWISLPRSMEYIPRDKVALYSKPTVRLVRGSTRRSPEPRVYLPEEITLPYSSPTLVGSSSSEFSVPNAEVHGVPPRVYLSPTLSAVFDYDRLSYEKQEDICAIHDADALQAGIHITDIISEPQRATRSSSPPAPTLSGLYELLDTSDAHIPPFEDSYNNTALVSDAQRPRDDTSHPISPEISPPPAVLTHPILVRRALSPWRRSSPPDVPYATKPAKETMSSAEPGRRHRPSVPSRLRFFITRSASVSLSSSRTHSSLESSLGKRSTKSSKTSKHSLAGRHNHGSSLSDVESHIEGNSTFITMLPANEKTSPLPENTTLHEMQLQDVDTTPKSKVPQLENDQPSFFDPPSPHTSEGSLESHLGDAEGSVTYSQEERTSGWFPASETRRASTAYRALLGLGLRVASEPVSVLPVSRPPSVFRSSVITEIAWAGGPVVGGQDEGHESSENRTQTNLSPALSLRTVFARWMNWRQEDPQDIIEEGRNFGVDSDVADESVEVMVMDRWAGLDCV